MIIALALNQMKNQIEAINRTDNDSFFWRIHTKKMNFFFLQKRS